MISLVERPSIVAGSMLVLLSVSVALQVARERRFPAYEPATRVMYVQSPALLSRLVLSFDALAADVYWIRAVQHYGGTKLSTRRDKRYDLLYPLLDITTTLDPRFRTAYRFGAILLAEGYPNGPGRPDLAVVLLRKGIQANPGAWEYLHDLGFVYYWWYEDYRRASESFLAASRVPGAPSWLAPVAASTLAQGGDVDRARFLWTQIRDTADAEWIRRTARLRLLQLDARREVRTLQQVLDRYREQTGAPPASWADLARRRWLPGTPVDPAGVPYRLLPDGTVDVAQDSPLWPVRRGRPPRAAP